MELMIEDDKPFCDAGDGDGDFFEIFSKVLTKNWLGRGKKRKNKNKIWTLDWYLIECLSKQICFGKFDSIFFMIRIQF